MEIVQQSQTLVERYLNSRIAILIALIIIILLLVRLAMRRHARKKKRSTEAAFRQNAGLR